MECSRQVRIVEMCQPTIAKGIVELEPTISSAMPCRVSVYEQDGKTILCILAASAMLGMFGVPEAAELAQEVEDTITRIMERAKRG